MAGNSVHPRGSSVGHNDTIEPNTGLPIDLSKGTGVGGIDESSAPGYHAPGSGLAGGTTGHDGSGLSGNTTGHGGSGLTGGTTGQSGSGLTGASTGHTGSGLTGHTSGQGGSGVYGGSTGTTTNPKYPTVL